MRVHKDIDKAGTIEFTANVVVEHPAGFEPDGQPYYDMDREVVARITKSSLPAVKRWLRDNLKTYARLHKNDNVLVEGNLDRVTWSEPYFEHDERLGMLKMTDDEVESIGYGVGWWEDGKVRSSVEEY